MAQWLRARTTSARTSASISLPLFFGTPGGLPLASYLAVPIDSNSGEVHGGLFLGHDEAGMFTAEAEQLVAGIAAHAAIALDNARLLQSAQSELLECKRQELAAQRLAPRAAKKFETFRIFSCLPNMQADFGFFSERFAAACRARQMAVDVICQSAGLSNLQARLLPVFGVKVLGVHELVQIAGTLSVSIDWLLGRSSVMEVPKEPCCIDGISPYRPGRGAEFAADAGGLGSSDDQQSSILPGGDKSEEWRYRCVGEQGLCRAHGHRSRRLGREH